MPPLGFAFAFAACRGTAEGPEVHGITTLRAEPAQVDPAIDRTLDVQESMWCARSTYAAGAFSALLVGRRTAGRDESCRVEIRPFHAAAPGDLRLEPIAAAMTDPQVAAALRALARETDGHAHWDIARRAGPAWIQFRQVPVDAWESLDIDACGTAIRSVTRRTPTGSRRAVSVSTAP